MKLFYRYFSSMPFNLTTRGKGSSKLRRHIRACIKISKSQDPYIHYQYLYKLESKHLTPKKSSFIFTIPKRFRHSAKYLIRQKLIAYTQHRWLLPELMIHSSDPSYRVALPIPKEFRDTLLEEGVRFLIIKSYILWIGFLFKMWARGVLTLIQLILSNITRRLLNAPKEKDYLVFLKLSENNIARDNQLDSHDFISWFMRNKISENSFDSIWAESSQTKQQTNFCMGKELSILPNIFPLLQSVKQLVLFGCDSFLAILLSGFRLLRGSWWDAFLLSDIIKFKYFYYLGSKAFASEYIFHVGVCRIRPLWTYLVEESGSAVTMVYYSANTHIFAPQLPPESYTGNPGTRIMTWSRYVVWGEEQGNFLRNIGHTNVNIKQVEYVDFSDSLKKLTAFPKNSVAVFDVSPVRISFHALLGWPVPYESTLNINKFYKDIICVTKSLDLSVVTKIKRKFKIDLKTPTAYQSQINSMMKQKNVSVIDPEIAASRMIQNSDIVISFPFTSTAIIAEKLGKPSAYYDPTGLLKDYQSVAGDIPLLLSLSSLKKWLTQVINS